jgi:hypothetical protein
VLFLAVLGLGVIISTLLTGLSSFGHHAEPFVWLSDTLAGLTNIGMYLIGFRVLTPKGLPLCKLLPGPSRAASRGPCSRRWAPTWCTSPCTVPPSTGVFATVLGLIAWIYLGVEVSVYAAEINVVLSRWLWPRAIIQPPLTEADRSSMALQALQNQRREEQHVEVTFDDRPEDARPHPATPETPDQVAPPTVRDAAQREAAQREQAQQD